ncbi:hypothetical protein CMV_000278 [Castanea mollissima]|uniref:Uncharacterized protein n=1 Tax=Castanea mollissima TaxID=60419 RepID=A0A8J4S1M2_9ROSI|nr:hypothetical protein CMV_000278 [Castanea mollissima]
MIVKLLKEERQKRMLAPEDASDEDNDDSDKPSTKGLRSISGDTLVDSFSLEEEPRTKKGWVDEILERRNENNSGSEADDSFGDSETAEDDSDEEGSDEDGDEVKPLMEMSVEIPYVAAICARQWILRTRTQFCEIIKDPEISSWPSSKTLFLLRLWSMIFPCFDFRHVVMTPAILLMCEYLMRCPIVCMDTYITPRSMASVLLTMIETLHGYVNIYEGFSSFPEMFLPISMLLLEVAQQENLPHVLQDKFKNVAQLIKTKASAYHKLRRPLLMRKQKPMAIKMLNPNFENFVKGRDYDADREWVEKRKLQKQVKHEAKGAACELRKDTFFSLEVKEKERTL